MLKGKVIVVTGGAGLMGKSYSNAIHENNGIPVIADIDEKAANEIAEKIDGGIALKLDITSDDSISEMIAFLSQKYGRIDGVINNAYPRNKNYGARFEDVTYSDFCENTSMHIGGYFLVSKLFCKFFEKQGYGNIINISSIYGVVAPRFEIYDNTQMTMPVEYSAIKAGVIHLTKYIASYFKGKNIRCNSVSLGGIEDGQPESFLKAYKQYAFNKGMLDPTDISGTIVFMLSDMSHYINGQNIVVDDGWSL